MMSDFEIERLGRLECFAGTPREVGELITDPRQREAWLRGWDRQANPPPGGIADRIKAP